MADLTRDEAIKWCVDNKADFVSGIFPPPNGWMWCEESSRLILSTVFTVTDQPDINILDVKQD